MNDRTDESGMRDLLARVATASELTPDPTSDPTSDLARGRTALRHRRRRRTSIGLGAIATAAVLAIGATAVVTNQHEAPPEASNPSIEGSPESHTQPSPSPVPAVEPVRLVSKTMEVGPYTFGKSPVGWNVLSNDRFGVTIARADDPNQSSAYFVGKLVVMLDNDPIDFQNGKRAGVVAGREIYATAAGDHLLLSVHTLPGEPGRTVRIQFPADLGWTREAAMTFLASVRVVDSDVVMSVG